MKRLARILPALAAMLALVSCSDAFGPIFSIKVEIRGPNRLIGQWVEAGRTEGVPSGYRCDPRLTLVSRGGSNDYWRYQYVVWNDMVIEYFDMDGRPIGSPQIYGGKDLDRLLGNLRANSYRETDRIPVVADRLPFRWRMTLSYRHPGSNKNGIATFSSLCTDV